MTASEPIAFMEDDDVSADYIISLTTYYDRFPVAHASIESMLHQECSCKYEVHLYLSKADIAKNRGVIPPRIEDLAQRGLKIFIKGEDLRSYKKLVYALRDNPGKTIITVDDDAIYPSDLLSAMIQKSTEHPGYIVCTNGYMLSFDRNGEFRPYRELLDAGEENAMRMIPSLRLMPVGVGGVLYPPHSLDEMALDSDMFMELCPHADDIWFKMASLKKDTLCVQVDTRNMSVATVPASQEMSLFKKNVRYGMNDQQFKACFDRYPDLFEKLKREFAASPDYDLYDEWIRENSRGARLYLWMGKYFLYKALSKTFPAKIPLSLNAAKYERRVAAAKCLR
jgi:hypothetical protein